MTERVDLRATSNGEHEPHVPLQPEIVLETEGTRKRNGMVLITGRSNPQLARRVGEILRLEVDEPITVFKNQEIYPQIKPNLRNKHVFIIQSTPAPADNILELYLMIRDARRASADEVTAVVPYYGYARQDRKDKPRTTVSGSDIANLLYGNELADRVLTIDIHSDQHQGFILGPWDNLFASEVLLDAIRDDGLNNVVVVSPDVGGSKRAEKLAELIGGDPDIAVIRKKRDRAGKAHAIELIGKVGRRDVLMIDDQLDTGGTVAEASKLLRHKGAKSVRLLVTHGLFTPPALENIRNSPIDLVVTTDTLKISSQVLEEARIKQVSIAPLLAEAIDRIHSGESLSALMPHF